METVGHGGRDRVGVGDGDCHTNWDDTLEEIVVSEPSCSRLEDLGGVRDGLIGPHDV